MAKTKTQPVVAPEPNETKTETPDEIRPNALAQSLSKELGIKIDGKRVRSFLRSKFPRDAESHNTNWALTPEQIKAARTHFTPKTADDSDES